VSSYDAVVPGRSRGIDEGRAEAALLTLLQLAKEQGITISRVKAAKLLYVCDLEATRRGVGAFTGVTWRWLQYGPFNYGLYSVEESLVRRGDVDRESVTTGFGVEYQLSATGPRPTYLDKSELAIMADVLMSCGRLRPSELRDISYRTAPMLAARLEGRGVDLNLALGTDALDLCGQERVPQRRSASPRASSPQSKGFSLPGERLPRVAAPKGELRRRRIFSSS